MASARTISPKRIAAIRRCNIVPLPPVLSPTKTRQQNRGDRGGGAPDIARRRALDGEDGHLVVAVVAAPEDSAEGLLGRERREGDREDLLHLVRGEDHLGLGRQEADEWADAEVRGRDVYLFQLPDHLDQVGPEVDLLLRLPQGRRQE